MLAATQAAGPVAAEKFYVDPRNGSPQGDGSKENPWRTLEGVVERGLIETGEAASHPHQEGGELTVKNEDAPVSSGDTISLRSGYHGALELQGAYNIAPITVTAAPGETPQLSHVRLRAASKWVLRGLHVSPTFSDSGGDRPRALVSIENHSWHGPSREVTVEDCHVFSGRDVANWTAEQWVERALTGIRFDAADVTVRDCRATAVRNGINASGENADVVKNVVDGFSGDGMLCQGDNSVFERNLVKNAYDVDRNHDDGFQSWSSGDDGPGSGVVKNVVLRGNLVINHENPGHPLRTNLQGIGCFDGIYEGWTVVNNVIITDHWHGITLLGARDCRIVNNTVVDLAPGEPRPWVKVGPHKDGRPSQNVVVRNNLASSFQLDSDGAVTADHNMEVDEPGRYFVDPSGFDLHLKAGSPAVDAGSNAGAQERDRDGVSRPQGESVDVGAYERRCGSPP